MKEAATFAAYERAAKSAGRYSAEKFDALCEQWGLQLGSLLYDAYLRGRVSKKELRRLFLTHLEPVTTSPKNATGTAQPGRRVCAAIFARTRR